MAGPLGSLVMVVEVVVVVLFFLLCWCDRRLAVSPFVVGGIACFAQPLPLVAGRLALLGPLQLQGMAVGKAYAPQHMPLQPHRAV